MSSHVISHILQHSWFLCRRSGLFKVEMWDYSFFLSLHMSLPNFKCVPPDLKVNILFSAINHLTHHSAIFAENSKYWLKICILKVRCEGGPVLPCTFWHESWYNGLKFYWPLNPDVDRLLLKDLAYLLVFVIIFVWCNF